MYSGVVDWCNYGCIGRVSIISMRNRGVDGGIGIMDCIMLGSMSGFDQCLVEVCVGVGCVSGC